MGSRESELAKQKVYSPEIRNKILANDRDEQHSYGVVFVRLPDDYRDRAQKSASFGLFRPAFGPQSS